MVVAAIVVVLAGLFALYGWRAVSEYRTLEATWVEYHTDMSRILNELRDRRKAYEDYPRRDNELSRLLDSFDEALHHTEAARLVVQDARALTFGGREIRAAMEENLDLIGRYYADVRETWVSEGGVDARLSAQGKAQLRRLQGIMESFQDRWRIRPDPDLNFVF